MVHDILKIKDYKKEKRKRRGKAKKKRSRMK